MTDEQAREIAILAVAQEIARINSASDWQAYELATHALRNAIGRLPAECFKRVPDQGEGEQ